MDQIKYKVIPNILNSEEIKLVKDYCKTLHINNKTLENMDMTQNNCGDTCFYKDPLMQSILNNKKEMVERAFNKKLTSTYTFWRCYTYGAELKKHKDRESCEYSVTLFIGSDDQDWPIFMEGKPVYLDPGDGIAYKGCDLEHWREPYKGDYHIQVFLHYVDSEGPYKDFKGDNRDKGLKSLTLEQKEKFKNDEKGIDDLNL